jgi:hypothetical protein
MVITQKSKTGCHDIAESGNKHQKSINEINQIQFRFESLLFFIHYLTSTSVVHRNSKSSGCESSVPFLQFTKLSTNSRHIGDRLV